MPVVHAPVGLCKTRLCKSLNFGKDDPCYWPQPYDFTVGHLAIIPCPDNSEAHPLRCAWYQADVADLELVNIPGLSGVMHLRS